MRTLIFTSLLILLGIQTALSQNMIGQTRKFLIPIPLPSCKIDGTLLNNDPEQFFANMKFTVIGSATSKPWAGAPAGTGGDAGYEIMIGSFDPTGESNSYFRYNFRPATGPLYYFITTDELNNMTVQIYPKWSPQFGAMAFAFKYRPQSGVFEPSFNLSATGGIKWDPTQLNNLTFLLLGGVGPSSVPIDQLNSNAQSASTSAAVSFSLSFVAQWKTVQLGISCGIDNLISPGSLKYNYQGRGWMSVGLGLTIFSTTAPSTGSATNNINSSITGSEGGSPALQAKRAVELQRQQQQQQNHQ